LIAKKIVVDHCSKWSTELVIIQKILLNNISRSNRMHTNLKAKKMTIVHALFFSPKIDVIAHSTFKSQTSLAQ